MSTLFVVGIVAVVVIGLLALMARLGSADAGEEHRLLLFGEGRNYRATFDPVIDALIAMNEKVVYVTWTRALSAKATLGSPDFVSCAPG